MSAGTHSSPAVTKSGVLQTAELYSWWRQPIRTAAVAAREPLAIGSVEEIVCAP